MNYTENLSLGLPEYGESADVADLNRNSGILDAYCYNTRQIECEPYDSTKTYMSGDLAIHNEVIYECNTDNTTGTWDDSKWDSTTLAEQIAKAKQSGGGAEVTKEASGNPIELTDAASAPMVKCVTEIQGSQDLHGYDKPWVGGVGKNKFKITHPSTSYTQDGITYTVIKDSDGNIHGLNASGTPTNNTSFIIGEIALKANVTYTLSGCPSGGGTNSYLLSFVGIGYDSGSGYTYTPTADETAQIRISVYTTAGNINLVFKPMVEIGSSATTFTPYSNICPITAYTEGEIEVRDGDGNTTTHTTTYPSAIYRGSEDCVKGEVTTEWGMIASYAGETLPGEWISDRDEYAPGTTPTTGAQVAYELATPTTAHVAVSNQPIKSLSGYNHIESSTGDMEIEYITSEYQPLVDLIQSSKHVYSTAEQIVGTWIDGSDLYEKTYEITMSCPANTRTDILTLTNENIVSLVGRAYYTSNSMWYVSPYDVNINQSNNNKMIICTHQSSGSPVITLVNGGFSNAFDKVQFTIRYTKTTQTRSLNAPVTSQKAQIEPLTDKTEEEPTEEEKAVNEEENNDETR